MDKSDDSPSNSGEPGTQNSIVPASRSENLLDVSTKGLSADEARALRGKALEAKLQVDRQRVEADDRFLNSSRDMVNTVKIVESLERAGKSDYEVNSQYSTASGQTSVRVKKATNQAIVIIAVAIAAVLLFLLIRQ